jgi:tRNA threonylcarbamoyladenosine biosynthesis protein TsaB
MNLLAADTSCRSCSVAVLSDGRVAAEVTTVTPRTHSAHLMHMVREALALAQAEVLDLDAFAVTVGPGSFTGLRIGISTVKGLAFAAGKPCIGVSSLEALAAACPPVPYDICSCMDARKRQVYAGVFRQTGGRLLRIGEERAAGPEDILDTGGVPRLFVGDGATAYADLIRARLGNLACMAGPELGYPKAAVVARLACAACAEGPMPATSPLQPRYLRRSDSELGIRQTGSEPA